MKKKISNNALAIIALIVTIIGIIIAKFKNTSESNEINLLLGILIISLITTFIIKTILHFAKNEENNQKDDPSKKIIKATIIASTSNSKKSTTSSIARGAIGGALLGTVGMLGGAVSGKTKTTNKTTFLVEYQDGHKKAIETITNGILFNKLSQYIETDNSTTTKEENKYDDLKKLKELLDSEIITKEEFDKEKKKILNK